MAAWRAVEKRASISVAAPLTLIASRKDAALGSATADSTAAMPSANVSSMILNPRLTSVRSQQKKRTHRPDDADIIVFPLRRFADCVSILCERQPAKSHENRDRILHRLKLRAPSRQSGG